jgi:hypothetical protein
MCRVLFQRPVIGISIPVNLTEPTLGVLATGVLNPATNEPVINTSAGHQAGTSLFLRGLGVLVAMGTSVVRRKDV